ncbi:MAG: hypothetical protein JRG93_11130 [Deltaproteobacteria bacterium]|nr:hypothetical protein [Deltaproteobacteria bacterium]
MHEQIFIAVYIVYLLEIALGRWRHLVRYEVPIADAPPLGMAPTRKRKGRYPSGFA